MRGLRAVVGLRWIRRTLLLLGTVLGFWLLGSMGHADAAPTPPPNPVQQLVTAAGAQVDTTVQTTLATVQTGVATAQSALATVQTSLHNTTDAVATTAQNAVATVHAAVATVQNDVATVQNAVATVQNAVATVQAALPTTAVTTTTARTLAAVSAVQTSAGAQATLHPPVQVRSAPAGDVVSRPLPTAVPAPTPQASGHAIDRFAATGSAAPGAVSRHAPDAGSHGAAGPLAPMGPLAPSAPLPPAGPVVPGGGTGPTPVPFPGVAAVQPEIGRTLTSSSSLLSIGGALVPPRERASRPSVSPD